MTTTQGGFRFQRNADRGWGEILPGEFYAADEIFISHSVTKVAPVERCEDRVLTAPGPASLKLMDLMNDVITFKFNRFSHWFQTWR